MNRESQLVAEFGQYDIPVLTIAQRYFNLDEPAAKRRAREQKYPFPVFRADGQKSAWMVSAPELATWLDYCEAIAKSDWQKMQGVRAA